MFKVVAKKVIRPDYLIIVFILLLSALFRLYKLRTAPDWFVNEGEFIRLADYLSKGNYDFLGIRNSILLIGRPPLFIWILAGAFKLFGTDIIILRGVSVICSILTIGVCYIITRQAIGRTAAFYAAFLLSIFPEYIFYNRLGSTYTWTSLWILIFVFALWKYHKLDSKTWLVIACVSAGIAFASDYIGIICALALFLSIVFTHPRYLWKMAIVAVPLLVSILPVFIRSPVAIWQDLSQMRFLGKASGETLGALFLQTIIGYSNIFFRQPLIVLGIVGVFTLHEERLRRIITMVMCGIIVLFLPIRILSGQYYLPVWPLLMIGLGSFLEKTVAHIYTFVKSSVVSLSRTVWLNLSAVVGNFFGSIGATAMVFVIVFLPITWMLILSLKSYIVTPLNPSLALVENPWFIGYIQAIDAETIAAEISQTVGPQDFVIAPSQVSWLLPCHTADIRTVSTYEFGGNTPGLGYYDMDRFVVNSSINNAKYVIVDDFWRVWMVDTEPEYITMLKEVQSWPMLLRLGSLVLFCNPDYCSSTN